MRLIVQKHRAIAAVRHSSSVFARQGEVGMGKKHEKVQPLGRRFLRISRFVLARKTITIPPLFIAFCELYLDYLLFIALKPFKTGFMFLSRHLTLMKSALNVSFSQ